MQPFSFRQSKGEKHEPYHKGICKRVKILFPPSQDSAASAKESLILRFSLGLRAMSFGDEVCVNH